LRGGGRVDARFPSSGRCAPPTGALCDRRAPRGGAEGRRLTAPASPRDFEHRLRAHEGERHASVFLEPPLRLPKTPRGIRYQDVMRVPGERGFVPLQEAARTMGETEGGVVELCRRGLLLYEFCAGQLYVQPAIVSVTSVVQPP
jgi:hypothetical protein